MFLHLHMKLTQTRIGQLAWENGSEKKLSVFITHIFFCFESVTLKCNGNCGHQCQRSSALQFGRLCNYCKLDDKRHISLIYLTSIHIFILHYLHESHSGTMDPFRCAFFNSLAISKVVIVSLSQADQYAGNTRQCRGNVNPVKRDIQSKRT